MFSLIKCTNDEDVKFFNYFTTQKVKPTSAIVHHEPGVPPGWPSRTSSIATATTTTTTHTTITTSTRSKDLIKFPNNLTQNDVVTSRPDGQIATNDQAPNKGVIDWIYNVLGFTTTPKPPKPISPDNCPKCG